MNGAAGGTMRTAAPERRPAGPRAPLARLPVAIAARRAPLARLLAAIVAGAMLTTGGVRLAAAGGDKGRIWQTIESEHFSVHFYAGLYLEAVKVVDVAERAWDLVTPALEHSPRNRIHVVLTDSTDGANGFALASPYPRIQLYVSAPDSASAFSDHADWMETLVTHEFTHIVHFDDLAGLPLLFNKIFGLQWTPNGAMPRWWVEGLATMIESDLTTAGGRARSAYVGMHVRTSILAGTFPKIDDFGSASYTYPRGDIAYYYGGAFLTWLAARYGYGAIAEYNHRFGRRPVPFALNLVAEEVFGDDFITLYRTWTTELGDEMRALRDRLVAEGLREGTRLTFTREATGYGRLSPGGDRIAYYHADAHDPAWMRIMEAVPGGDKKARRVTSELGFNGPAWTPDGRALVAMRVEPWKNFYNYTDLFRIELDGSGRITRLTYGARARFPDVSKDGRFVVFERAHGGGQDLAIIVADGSDPAIRTLVESLDLSQCYTPRFSPDGKHVVFGWHKDGRMDVAIADVATGTVRRLTDDGAVDLDPVFSADGRHVYFAADRGGIYNLYAYELATDRVFMVTNVIGGAFQPDPSPDGRSILYRRFDTGGFDLWSLPVDPASWREVPRVDPLPRPVHTDTSAWRGKGTLAARAAAELDRVHRYRPWVTLLPRSWRPLYGADPYGPTLGLSTGASDPAGLHAWSASLAWGLVSGDPTFSVGYTYTGLFPTLSVSGGRLAAARNDLRIDGVVVPYVEEQWFFSAGASFSFNRAGGNHSVSLRYDGAFLFADRPIDVVLDPGDREPRYPDTGYIGGVSLGWSWSNRRGASLAIAPEEGRELAVTIRLRDPALGSNYRSFEVSWRWEEFIENPFIEDHVLAIRAAGGLSAGDFRVRRTYSLGGPSDQNVPLALVTGGRVGAGYIRGYDPGELAGNRFTLVNFEYRFPIAIVERGLGTIPVYWNRIYGLVFCDVGNAYDEPAEAWELHPSAGAEVLVDATLAYYIPVTLRIGVAQAFWGIADPEARHRPQFYIFLGNVF